MPTARAPHVARYRLAERLGAGGLGVVMAAEDPELGRRVAIKLIRMGTTDRRAFERLEREAAALARVSHPNVVGVFDVGRYDARASDSAWPDDVPRTGVYIVMELCEGTELAAWLRTPRTPQEVLRVFRDAAAGLVAAHAAGVVHRDFKPANVVVDASGGVKVLDFGLAQWLHGAEPSTLQEGVEDGGPAEPAASSMTMTGTVMGTPAYMAPEQHRGARLDERTDQYAFCVALAEALCGARPFAGDTVAELHDAKHQLRFDPRMREISPRLRAVLERGLAREPEARWGGMAELSRALEEPRSYAAWWATGLSIGAAALAGWVVIGSARPPEPAAPASEVTAAVIDGHAPSAEARALRDAAEVAWAGRDAKARIGALLEATEAEAMEIDTRASVASLLDGPTQGPLVHANPSLAAEVLLWRGRAGDDATAVELYRRAYFIAREADVPTIAARAAIAMTTTSQDDHGQVIDEWIRHAWIEVERAPDDRRAAIEVAITSAHGRSIGADEALAIESLAFAEAVVGDVEPDDGVFVANLLLELAAGWRAVDRPESAFVWIGRAQALLDAVAEPDHPLRWLAAAELAKTLYWEDRCVEAQAPFDLALAGFAAVGPEAEEEAAMARALLAECLHAVGRLEEAMLEHRRALAFWEAERPEITVPRQRGHLEIARILVKLGRTEDAEREYERVLAVVDPSVLDQPSRRHAREELAALRGQR
jgi:tetratricopeptide (TPR) repeat protein